MHKFNRLFFSIFSNKTIQQSYCKYTFFFEYRSKKRVSCLYRAATTKHPCYIPVLGDSMGAGRIRLTRNAKVRLFPILANFFSPRHHNIYAYSRIITSPLLQFTT